MCWNIFEHIGDHHILFAYPLAVCETPLSIWLAAWAYFLVSFQSKFENDYSAPKIQIKLKIISRVIPNQRRFQLVSSLWRCTDLDSLTFNFSLVRCSSSLDKWITG